MRICVIVLGALICALIMDMIRKIEKNIILCEYLQFHICQALFYGWLVLKKINKIHSYGKLLSVGLQVIIHVTSFLVCALSLSLSLM